MAQEKGDEIGGYQASITLGQLQVMAWEGPIRATKEEAQADLAANLHHKSWNSWCAVWPVAAKHCHA